MDGIELWLTYELKKVGIFLIIFAIVMPKGRSVQFYIAHQGHGLTIIHSVNLTQVKPML